jgi:hypothetical protein
MASAITKSRDNSGEPGSTERDLLVKYNVLVAAFDVLCAKLDADAGVTDTNYAALAGNLCSRIGDMSGTAITS